MSEIAIHVGKKIRLLRKAKGITLQEFSYKINKSVPTLSKYERGDIVIDIETLFAIAEALECSVRVFTDYQSPAKTLKNALPTRTIFGSQNMLYMYFNDGSNNKIARNHLRIGLDADRTSFRAELYMHIASYETYYDCRHYYSGEFRFFDLISHFYLANQVNNVEQLCINVLNPLDNSTTMMGLLSGISGSSFLPSASKVLLSRTILPIDEQLFNQLKFSKEEVAIIKKNHILAVSRSK